MITEILPWVLVLLLGFFWGFLVKLWLTNRSKEYIGTLVVDKDELHDKTLYSLVLDDYPDTIELKKEVVFKVDISAKSSDRE